MQLELLYPRRTRFAPFFKSFFFSNCILIYQHPKSSTGSSGELGPDPPAPMEAVARLCHGRTICGTIRLGMEPRQTGKKPLQFSERRA